MWDIDIFYEFLSHFDPPIHHFKATIFHKTSNAYAVILISLTIIGSRTSELTVVAIKDILVLRT